MVIPKRAVRCWQKQPTCQRGTRASTARRMRRKQKVGSLGACNAPTIGRTRLLRDASSRQASRTACRQLKSTTGARARFAGVPRHRGPDGAGGHAVASTADARAAPAGCARLTFGNWTCSSSGRSGRQRAAEQAEATVRPPQNQPPFHRDAAYAIEKALMAPALGTSCPSAERAPANVAGMAASRRRYLRPSTACRPTGGCALST